MAGKGQKDEQLKEAITPHFSLTGFFSSRKIDSAKN
jgi:hypothetical protein